MFQTRPPRDKERRRDRYRESEGHQRQLSPRDAVHRQPASPGVYRDERDRHHYISSGYQSSKPYRRPSPGRRHSSPGRNLLDYRGGGPAGRDFTSSPTHSCIPVDHNLIITVGNNSSHSGSPEHRRVDPHELTHGSNVYSSMYQDLSPSSTIVQRQAAEFHHNGTSFDVDINDGGITEETLATVEQIVIENKRDTRTINYGDGLEEDYGRRYSSHDRSGIDYRRGSPHYPPRLNEESRGRSREREKYKNDRYSSKESRQDPYDMDHDDRSYSSERSRHSERTAERSQRSRSRGRCRGRSRSRSRSPYGKNASDGFRELEMARKRKEQEEMEKLEKEIAQRDSGGPAGYDAQGRSVEISDYGQARLDGTLHMPKKSILKKRVETEGDFSFTDENNDFTSGTTKAQTSNVAMETDRFLHVLNKGIDTSLFSALIKEARRQSYSQSLPKQPPETSEDHCENFSKDEDPKKNVDNINEFLLPHERASQDGSGFSRILSMMGDFPTPQEKSQTFPDIEDEEKFLYGDEDEERTESPVLSHSLPTVNVKPSLPEVSLFQELHSQVSTQQLSQLQPEKVGKLKNKHLESQTLGTWHPNKESPSSTIHLKETSPLRSHQPLNQSVLGHYQESTSNVSHHQENKRNSHSQETIKCSRTVTSPYTSVLPEESKDLSMVKSENVEDHSQETQEYEKIQNLLKTIGLDFGVSEISNLATRIRERLHGKKPQPTALRVSEKMREKKVEAPTNWERPRRPSETRSPEIEYNNSVSASSARRSSHNENISSSSLDYSAEKGCNIPVLGESAMQPPPIPVASVAITSSSAQPVSSVSVTPSFPVESYSQYVPMMPPSTFPMPSYEHYNSYLPYPPQSWSIYSTPPPLPPPPPPIQGSIPSIPQPTFPVLSKKEEQSLKSSRPFLRVIETVPIENKTELKKEESSLVQVPIVENFQRSSSSSIVVQQQKVAEEKNKATEKQKVIEEREKLRKEKESRLKRKEYLMKELERLRKQQGELLRKKRREKDGHKDPLLTEVSRLQEEVMQQISVIRKEHEEAEKKRAQLDKVAQILGLHISEKSKKVVKERENIPEKSREKSQSPDKSSYTCSSITAVTTTTITASSAGPASSNKESSHSKLPSAKIKSAKTVPPQSSPKTLEQYEYYDAGNHWCKNCNTLYGSMFDFFTHLHSKAHRKTQDPYDRPWAAKTSNTDGKLQTGKNMEKIVVPAKGSEFLTPVIGFYCLLCEKCYGDQIAAEEHVSCHDHNEKYKKYIEENPLYEQRRNLDRQAGLAAVMDNKERRQTEMKRKMVEESGSLKGEDVKAKIVIKEDTEEPDSPMESEEKAVLQKLDSTFKPLVQMKLKKKPEETVKPVAGVKMFGKFNWKKEQKEEEKKETPVEDTGDESKEKEDGKTQLGKAKPIAIRLSGKTIIPQTTAWTRSNSTPALSSQAKIRPNLPLPAMVLRKSTTASVGKPAPLNAFLSIKSSGNNASKPLPVIKSESKKDVVLTPDLISKAFGGEEVVLKVPPCTEDKTQTPTETILPHPPPPPPVLQVMSFESDVAAPGVPESEQTRTMLVRPPPFCGASTMKTEKPKSSLATANAKDLYDIFYSSGAKSSCDLKFVSADQDTIKEDKPEIKETKTDVPSRNEKNAGLDQVSKSVGSESDTNTEDNLTLIKASSVSVKESENQMESKILRVVNVGESCCADPVPFVSDVNAVECESSLPPLEDENLFVKPLITSADIPADENNASDFGNSEISISPVPEIKVDDIPFQSEVEENTLVLRHDVSLNSDIHMDEPDSLDTALQSNVFCDQETSDHFETNDFMPSDGKAYSFNLEDNDQDQPACFKEISTVHESVDLEVSSDEPETIRLEIAEKEVSLVEQSSFEVLSLNLSSADLNLDTYDIGFETTDLSVSEATNESVPMETEKSNDETCGIPLDTAELNISEIANEFVPVETENTRGKMCNEDFETAGLNEIANELVPIESEEPCKTCVTGFDNTDLNVPDSENEPPTKEADIKNDFICGGHIFKTENVNDSEMEKQPLLEEVLKANDSTGGPTD